MESMDIAERRLISQHIQGMDLHSVRDIVNWMGAMQAQDHGMAEWGIGVRLPGSTNRTVEAAINTGEIFRTHLLRTTWHFVSADDIRWMLALRAKQIKTGLATRHKELGLSEEIIRKSNEIFKNAMKGGHHLTRDEIVSELKRADIVITENRASHIMLRAEMDGVVCSGAIKNGKLTYALLEERVPRTNELTKEEALAKAAEKYFNSHGPATLQDFTWWSGLSAGDAKQALELVKQSFISETIDSQTYWFREFRARLKRYPEAVHLLPAFDEYIISYKDRRAMLSDAHFAKIVSTNGIFRPVIVVNGQVVGIWKREVKKDHVVVETEFFTKPNQDTLESIKKASKPFGLFLEKEIKIIQK